MVKVVPTSEGTRDVPTRPWSLASWGAAQVANIQRRAMASHARACLCRERNRAQDVSPNGRIMIIAATGTLTDVTMVNENDKRIPGVITPDGRAWHPTEQLGYGHEYTMTIASLGPGGMPTRQTSSFETLTPSDQTELYFDTTGGNLIYPKRGIAFYLAGESVSTIQVFTPIK